MFSCELLTIGRPTPLLTCSSNNFHFSTSDLSIRDGNWEYLDHKRSGGNDYNQERLQPYALRNTDPDAPGQLYNLNTDPGESNNLYRIHPAIVQKLKTQLEEYKTSGRSAPAR